MKLLNISPAQRKSLLVLPLIILPGLCLIFFMLGGGGRPFAGPTAFGLNPELPRASVEGRQLLDKKLQYEQAERDSLRKVQYRMQDPYRRDSAMIKPSPLVAAAPQVARSSALPAVPVPAAKPGMASDPRADQVLTQLEQLRQVIRQPSPLPPPPSSARAGRVLAGGSTDHYRGIGVAASVEDTMGDARVGRLNDMLEKVIRIQHPDQARVAATAPVRTDEVLPADSGGNAITAVVADNQTLVAGVTVALRITDSIRVNGSVVQAGQLIYGKVSITGDRMLVHITALRRGRSLYSVDLQAYDLDGIDGIHIPGMLSRDVAKESADQGVSSLNVLNVDPSLGAQAAGAGIQMAKSFASRKVRQVRVSVPAGYQLLLRDAHAGIFSRRDPVVASASPAAVVEPNYLPEGEVVSSCRNEGVELRLRGVWLELGLLWFGLEYSNRSAIVYTPAYVRWFIRDRRQVRRTAIQELSLEPVSAPAVMAVTGDSLVHTWTGFAPFTLAKDKELILEVGEKGGGRTLTLRIKHTAILDAKSIRP